MPVIITAKRNGFRRCGIAHTDKPTSYPNSRFTEKELARLQAEPMLVVQVVESETKTEDASPESDDKTASEMAEPEENGETEAATEATAIGEDLTEIMAVFPSLGDDDFKTDGVPRVASVEKALGRDVTADQVAAAWAAHQEKV